MFHYTLTHAFLAFTPILQCVAGTWSAMYNYSHFSISNETPWTTHLWFLLPPAKIFLCEPEPTAQRTRHLNRVSIHIRQMKTNHNMSKNNSKDSNNQYHYHRNKSCNTIQSSFFPPISFHKTFFLLCVSSGNTPTQYCHISDQRPAKQ